MYHSFDFLQSANFLEPIITFTDYLSKTKLKVSGENFQSIGLENPVPIMLLHTYGSLKID